jgi:DNA-binding NtrC family response regulator
MEKIDASIVIIDDQIQTDRPLVVKLQQRFKDVKVFNKPKEGLDFIEENLEKKLIVILDIKFPEAQLDGHSVLEKINKKTELTPVILWSAVDEKDETFSDFINNKAYAFLKQTTPTTDIVDKVVEAYEAQNSNIASAIEEYLTTRLKFDGDKDHIITLSDGKKYTLEQLLDEVRTQTPFGRQFSKDLNILTIDLLLRGKKKL